jgi:membrane protein YqaA with SNARE-associated domain
MHFASAIFALLRRFGGVGLLVLGVLDSSYLFAPWGNDLLLIALASRHPGASYVFYLAVMSTAGSVLGCLLLDVTIRPLGERGLERYLSRRRLNRVREKVSRNAGRALAVAALAPPPFPFTAFVMAAAALQYPRARLVSVIAATRLFRFTLLGALALHFGYRIVRWTRNPVLQRLLVALTVVCLVGSIISGYHWVKHSRSAAGRGNNTRGR